MTMYVIAQFQNEIDDYRYISEHKTIEEAEAERNRLLRASAGDDVGQLPKSFERGTVHRPAIALASECSFPELKRFDVV